MPNLCETCPIQTKIENCCGSNPDTGETRTVVFKKSGLVVDVCNLLQNDGACASYEERPVDCASYLCEPYYALGLGGQEL